MPQFNNEKSNQINSNSFGFTSRNYTSMTALAVNYFNNMAILSIHLPDESSKKEYPSFNYNEGIKSYLSAKDAKLLYKMGKKAFKKFEENGEFEEFGLPLKRGLIQIAQAKDLKKKLKSLKGDIDPSDICIVIYTDLDDSKKTDKYLIHVFNEDSVVRGYSPDNGEYALEKNSVEFEYFLDALNEFAKAMTNGYAHAQKHDSRFDRKKWERMAYELATSLGVDLSKPSKPSKPTVSWVNESSGSSVGSRADVASEARIVEVDEENIDAIIQQMVH